METKRDTGKVVIRFWDKDWDGYFTSTTASWIGLRIDQHGNVYNAEKEEMKNIEPHYYIDGVRIDGERDE